MNYKSKKAESDMNVMGIILIAFVAIVVGLAFYQSIVSYVGQVTGVSLTTSVNATVPVTAVGVITELPGQELVSTIYVVNRTTGETIGAANYSLYECVKTSSSMKGICYKPLVAGQAQGVNITYSYYPEGYIDDAGGRSLALLIPIFAALAIAIVALVPALRSGVMDMMKS
jgi:hypothetical protein